MAGFLPEDSSHIVLDGGPYQFSHAKQNELGHSSSNWYLSRKEVEDNSPSRRDGIDLKTETYLSRSYCTLLQDLGMRLKVPQVTIATAITFFHRFFLRQSHAKNDGKTIATVCMFLAGKVEETPRPLKDVILVSFEIIHKKDPAAVQRIKQKEIYEHQKEVISLGERVVLATLGFDLNVHHPYKPLIEVIKKFKVSQNALAQVAWNFVNDGLRTTLCLQFMPHHIAAGAIFLAAKFLRVRLPSDGEKVWWEEFDVTPWQLEEVSDQMLELYEQNHTFHPTHGIELEGSGDGGSNHRAPPPEETLAVSGEPVLANGHLQGVAAATVQHRGVVSSTATRLGPDKSYMGSQDVSQKSANFINRGGNAGTIGIWDHKVDGGSRDSLHSELDKYPYRRDSIVEASNRSMNGSELTEDETEPIDRIGSVEPREWNDGGSSYKPTRTVGQNSISVEGYKGHYPLDAIRKIDKEKVNIALEKRRKFQTNLSRKTDSIDDNDIIKREQENDIDLTVEEEKMEERRQSCHNPSYQPLSEKQKLGKVESDVGDKNILFSEQQISRGRRMMIPVGTGHGRGQDDYNVEEGELPSFDAQEYCPKSGSRRKRRS